MSDFPAQGGDAATLAVVVDRLRRIGANLDLAVEKMATQDEVARLERENEKDLKRIEARIEKLVTDQEARIRELEKKIWGSGLIGTGGAGVGIYALYQMVAAKAGAG